MTWSPIGSAPTVMKAIDGTRPPKTVSSAQTLTANSVMRPLVSNAWKTSWSKEKLIHLANLNLKTVKFQKQNNQMA